MRAFVRLSSLALLLSALASPAFADDACKSFKWDIAREQAWFQASPPSLASGGTAVQAAGAVSLQLSPVDTLAFPVSPEHKPAAGSHGAIFTLPTIAQPASYQVTLSDEGWIDVIQDSAPVKSGAYSGVKGCPGVRKSVRFALKPGPVTLQVSGVKAQTINVAIAPAE